MHINPHQHHDTWVKVDQIYLHTLFYLIWKNFLGRKSPSTFVVWQLFGLKIGLKLFDSIEVEALYTYQFT